MAKDEECVREVAEAIANVQRVRCGLRYMTADQIESVDPVGWGRATEEARHAIGAFVAFKKLGGGNENRGN